MIFLDSLDHPVCDLLFERTRDPLRVQDMLRRDEGRRLFLCDITRDADQSAKLAEPQGELTAASSSPLSLPQDLEHSCPVEVGNLAIFRDLLRVEPHELEPDFFRIAHRAFHVNLLAVSGNPRSQPWMHHLDRGE